MEKEVDKLEKILQEIPFIKEDDIPQRTLDCLAEERLEEYYQGALSKSERMKLDKHLLGCRYCRQRLVIFDDLTVGEFVEVPGRLIAKTKQLDLGSSRRILEIVLSSTRKAIRIIKNTGELLTPSLVLQPARGQEIKEKHDQLYDFVTISKEFEDLKMEVQIECINDAYKVILNASDPDSNIPITGARLALYSEGRELSSVDESEAIFYLKLRQYLIKVLFDEKELGEIHLDLRGVS